MLDGFDPSTIPDPALRQLVQALMNQVEELHAKVRAQADEIQRLRDENNRLKGEQGKPDIKPNKPPRQSHSVMVRAAGTAPAMASALASLASSGWTNVYTTRGTMPLITKLRMNLLRAWRRR
jgi:regulator of replication initiation timing